MEEVEDEDDEAVLVALTDSDVSRPRISDTVSATVKSVQSESCAKESLMDMDAKMINEFVVC